MVAASMRFPRSADVAIRLSCPVSGWIIGCMAPSRRHSRRSLRKAAGRRARAGALRKDRGARDDTIDFTDPVVVRRWKRRSLAAISVGAAVGITWYALAPGVAAYTIGYTLALPAIITAIVWIGKRLPRWLDWVIAVALGAAGSLAYVLFDGSQWWLWAQVALLPSCYSS